MYEPPSGVDCAVGRPRELKPHASTSNMMNSLTPRGATALHELSKLAGGVPEMYGRVAEQTGISRCETCVVADIYGLNNC